MLPGRPPSPRDRAFNGQPKRFAANAAWLELVLIAQDLMAWTRALCLQGALAAAGPKRLRFAL